MFNCRTVFHHYGQGNGDTGSVGQNVFDLYRAVVFLDDFLDDRQPQPRTLGFGGNVRLKRARPDGCRSGRGTPRLPHSAGNFGDGHQHELRDGVLPGHDACERRAAHSRCDG